MIFDCLARRLIAVSHRRPPDFVIGRPDAPYLRRWWLIPRNRWCNVYLHHFLRSDDDRALHDHPWRWNCSVLLAGNYIEHTPDGARRRTRGALKLRIGPAPHRIELIDAIPVWTLFVTGPKVREWGFHCERGWRHWREFTAPNAPGQVGRGCDE